MDEHIVVSGISSISQPKPWYQHKVKPSFILVIQKMDTSQIWQEQIATRSGLSMQYASRYGPYLIIDIIDFQYFPPVRHGHHPNERNFSS